uniref:Essential meiotic structure-specific endonuclease 1 n=1 Tax=Amazona collaria TaxID=241587 RepID=A0A8B9EY76_9PSIT
MAESRVISEESDEERLPTLASLLQTSPSPPCDLGRRRSSSPVPKAGSEEEVVVVVSSGSDDDDEEVVPLPERIKRRMEVRNAGFEVSCSSQRSTQGGERPSLCPLPASQSDSAAQPNMPLISGASPEVSPLPKKLNHSQKEREAMCQSWQRRKEREALRRQKEEEKERKRALAKMLKAQRPGECRKYITVVLDSVLLQVEGGEQVLSALQAANYSCVVENQAVPCSITWRRKTVSCQMGEGDKWTEEPNVLVVLRLEEFLSMAHNYKQEARGCMEGQQETLQTYVARVMEKMPGKILALAVAEVENYFRLQSKKRQRQAAAANGRQDEGQGRRRKKAVEESGLEITRMDVEEALVDLQLSKQVQVSFFESWEELGEYATMFTKSVAEAPFKRERENTGFSFYLEKAWCGGVKVDHSGKGLLEVWKRQLQQFNRVSLEMAEAIVSAYPSPQLLNQAYIRCSSEQERENMLANITVSHGDGVTATCRRIGPELSRRVYLQMTSHDPDLYLDVSG